MTDQRDAPTIESTVAVQGDSQPERVLVAEPTKEYVASGQLSWYGALVRALPRPIDDLEADFGTEIYDAMMLDPEASSSINSVKAAVIDAGVHCTAPELDEAMATEENMALADEIARATQAMLNSLDTPIDEVLWDLLDAMVEGNRVAELTWIMAYSQAWQGGRMEPRSIRVKPRDAYAFIVDDYNNLLGILPLKTAERERGKQLLSAGSAITTGVLLDDWQSRVLPLEKFVVYTHRPQNGDPRGRSALRAAYNPWWIKQQIFPEWLKYLAQFATGMLIGTTAEGADDKYIVDTDTGEPRIDPSTGLPMVITAEELMLTNMVQLRNGSAVVFKYGSQVEVVTSTGEGQAFLRGFDQCDAWIRKGILNQTLATGEGEHQARAAAEVHKGVMDNLIAYCMRSTAVVIRRDIVWPYVKYNWGEEIANLLCPLVGLGQVEETQLSATDISQLHSSGYLDPSHYQATDQMLGLTPRPQESIDAMTAAKEAGRALAVQAANGLAAGGTDDETEEDSDDSGQPTFGRKRRASQARTYPWPNAAGVGGQ